MGDLFDYAVTIDFHTTSTRRFTPDELEKLLKEEIGELYFAKILGSKILTVELTPVNYEVIDENFIPEGRQ